MKYNLNELYKIAKDHKDNHKSCGGEPYKSYDKLFEVVQNFSKNSDNKNKLKILEVGTAVGFTTFVLYFAISPDWVGEIDTIEFHAEHIELAKQNITEWGGEISKINFLQGDAKDILPKLCRTPGQEHTWGGAGPTYDLIFFDGYGAKLIFYKDFERLLKIGGLLITANQHLKSTEKEYFQELNDSNKWEFVEEFADTKIYKKLL